MNGHRVRDFSWNAIRSARASGAQGNIAGLCQARQERSTYNDKSEDALRGTAY